MECGNHVAIRRPIPRVSSQWCFTLVDIDYKCNIGKNGSISDAKIYNTSEWKECLKNGMIGFTNPDPMPNSDHNMPYHIFFFFFFFIIVFFLGGVGGLMVPLIHYSFITVSTMPEKELGIIPKTSIYNVKHLSNRFLKK